MENTQYRLQLLSHKDMFATRDAAAKYIDDNFRYESLVGEPAVVFYGDTDKPNMILVIGAGNKRVCSIDVQELTESINALETEENAHKKDLENALVTLQEVITASGLEYDDNRKTNQVYYNPNVKDALIGNAENISDAIAVISKYVQDTFADIELSVEDSSSVKLTYKDGTDGGKVLKAVVNISNSGDDDSAGFNDNIIGIKNDGLYVAAHLEYDETKNTLTFSTSGFKNGRFTDDAIKQVINLGDHSVVDVSNSDDSPIKLKTEKPDSSNTIISASVKLSSDKSNILEVKDGALFVEGTAKNIAYKDTNVFEAVNALSKDTEAIKQTVDFTEIDTDTFDLTINKGAGSNGATTFKGDVKLSSDGSIEVANGGIRANVDVTVDTVSNSLTFKLGNTTKVMSLPSVDFSTLIKSVDYDKNTGRLTITFAGGQTATVSVEDLFVPFSFESDSDSPIKLTAVSNSDGSSTVKASVVLRSSDNMVSIENGKLYVSQSEVKKFSDDVNTTLTAALNVLSQSLTDEVNNRTNAVSTLEGKIQDTKDAVDAERERATAADTELATRTTKLESANSSLIDQVAEVKSDVSVQGSDIADIKTNATALSERFDAEVAARKTSDTTLQTNIDAVSDNLAKTDNKVSANTTNLANEIARATAKENEIALNVATNNTAISNEIARAQTAESTLSDNITKNAQAIALLNGSATQSGSVREIVSHVSDDITAAVAAEKSRAEVAEKTNADAIAALTESVGSGSADTLQKAKDYTDAEIVKETAVVEQAKNDAIATSSADATTKSDKALADAKSYTDSRLNTHELEEKTTHAELVSTSEKYADEKDAATLTSAKEYTDSKIDEVSHVIDDKETSLKQYTTDAVADKTNEVSNDLKAYADDAVAVEKARSEAAEKVNADAIAELETADENLKAEIIKKIETVEVKKNEASDLQYTLYVDGKPAGNIDIPEDQFLKSASYDKDTHILKFIFRVNGEDQTVDMNISDLIKIYTAGDGINENDNVFSLKIADDSEAYIAVSADGLKIVGIDKKLDEKANKSDVYTKDEADGKFLTEHQDLSDYATVSSVNDVKADVEDVETNVHTLSEAVDKINGNSATDGSIAKALADANAYTDDAVKNEKERAEGVENTLSDKIEVINGNSATEGSIAKALADSKVYTDEKVSAETERASEKETELDDKIKIINGNAATEGSIAKALEDAKAYANEIVGNENTRAIATEKTLSDAVAVLNGNEAEIGSVKNAIKVADDYTDVKVDNEATARELADIELTSKVDAKANSADVYTKAEIDSKNFLTQHQDISNLATIATVDAVEAKVEANEDAMDALKLDVKANKFETSTSSTIALAMTADADSNKTLEANLKVANVEGNIIKQNESGIYAVVAVDYNKATNVLSVNNGNGIQSFQLSDHTLVTNGYYDSENKSVVLTVSENGVSKNIVIPVSQLINNFVISNSDEEPVKLTKVTGADGVDVLSASIAVSQEEYNLIVDRNGTLYASNRAEDHTVSYDGVVMALSAALYKVKGVAEDASDTVNAISGQIEDIKEVADGAAEKVEEYGTKITDLESSVENAIEKANDAETSVSTYENRIKTLETYKAESTVQISALTTRVESLESENLLLKTRLAKVEEIVNSLIDFDTY